MKKKNPLVSVVLPAYNAEKFLKKAIQSIINQDYNNFELLVINDASTDKTKNIIKKLAQKDKRIKTLHNKTNQKIARSLNRAIKAAQGKYIVRADADDICHPQRISTQVAFMEKNSNVIICGSAINIINVRGAKTGSRFYNQFDKEIRKKIFRYSPFCHPSIIFRRKKALTAGLYNPYLDCAQDYELYFRLGKLGAFANLDKKLYSLRFHGKSTSALKSRRQEYLTLLIRAKAVLEYRYRMTLSDKLFWLAQFISMFLIPQTFKLKLFSFFRNKNK